MNQRFWRYLPLVIGLFAILQGPESRAADVWTPRSAGLGGAGRAGPLLNDAIFLNPAFTSLLPTNSFAFNWLSYKANDSQARGRNYTVSVQDGRSELFQAGAAYTLREDLAFVHFGVAKSLVQRLGFGIAGKHIISAARETNAQDAVFAMTAVPIDWFQVAFVVDNILETELGKDHGMYRDYAFGFKFNVKGIVLAYFDPHITPSLERQFGYSGGLEFVVMQDLFLRVGKFDNVTVPYLATRGRGYGTGFSWIAPRLSIDYALSRTLNPLPVTAHTFSFTVYL